jgi:hypothetical protein
LAEEYSMTTIEVWIVMNEDGDYEVGKDEDDAIERFEDDVGSDLARSVIGS